MTTFDPLSAAGRLLRARGTAARGARWRARPSGPWYLARYADVLAATQDVELFQAQLPRARRDRARRGAADQRDPRAAPRPGAGASSTPRSRCTVSVNIEPFCERPVQRRCSTTCSRSGRSRSTSCTDYVMPVPNNVIAHLLGAPRADFPRWAAWSDEVVQGTWPALNRNERGEGLPGAHPEFSDYVDALIEARRDDPARRLHHPAAGGRGRRASPHRRRGAHPARVPLHLRQRDHPPPHRQPALDRRAGPRPLRAAAGRP